MNASATPYGWWKDSDGADAAVRLRVYRSVNRATMVAMAAAEASIAAEAAVAAAEQEIVTLSERIRREWECPVCLQIAPVMLCNCPNGHAMCGNCMVHFRNGDEYKKCPLCRSPMSETPKAMVVSVKMAEVMARVKVACTYRQHGCTELVVLCRVTLHEEVCPFKPGIPCLVPVCQWMGDYDQLFNHVNTEHPGVAVVSTVICGVRKRVVKAYSYGVLVSTTPLPRRPGKNPPELWKLSFPTHTHYVVWTTGLTRLGPVDGPTNWYLARRLRWKKYVSPVIHEHKALNSLGLFFHSHGPWFQVIKKKYINA